MSEAPYYCYRLKYPQGFIADDGTDLSGIVFYIGKGQGGRMNEHEAEARAKRLEERANLQKIVVIRSIWAKGMIVQKEVFFRSHCEHEVLISEAWDIRDNMGPYLTNRRILSVVAIEGFAARKPDPKIYPATSPLPSRQELPEPSDVYCSLNAALIVDGLVQYCNLSGGSSNILVPVIIKCQGVCIDGRTPCTSHIGEEVTIVDAPVVLNHWSELLTK